MNFFSRYRVIKWVLIGTLVVALSALGTTLYITWKETKEIEKRHEVASSCMRLSNVLNFNATQNADLQKILNRFDDTSAALVTTLREQRQALMDELQKEHPDSIQIQLFTQEIGSTQTLLTRLASDQYLQIRKVCDSSQQLKLSDFYCDMFGCPRVGCKEGDTCQKNGQRRNRQGNE